MLVIFKEKQSILEQITREIGILIILQKQLKCDTVQLYNEFNKNGFTLPDLKDFLSV